MRLVFSSLNFDQTARSKLRLPHSGSKLSQSTNYAVAQPAPIRNFIKHPKPTLAGQLIPL
jgi:hypothetical protein